MIVGPRVVHRSVILGDPAMGLKVESDTESEVPSRNVAFNAALDGAMSCMGSDAISVAESGTNAESAQPPRDEGVHVEYAFFNHRVTSLHFEQVSHFIKFKK